MPTTRIRSSAPATTLADQALASGTNFVVLLYGAGSLSATDYVVLANALLGAMFVSGIFKSFLVDEVLRRTPNGHHFESDSLRWIILATCVIWTAGGSAIFLGATGGATSTGLIYGLAVSPVVAMTEVVRASNFANAKPGTNLAIDTAWMATVLLCIAGLELTNSASGLSLIAAWSLAPAGLLLVGKIKLQQGKDQRSPVRSHLFRSGSNLLAVDSVADAISLSALFVVVESQLGLGTASALALARVASGPGSIVALAVPAFFSNDRGKLALVAKRVFLFSSITIVFLAALSHVLFLLIGRILDATTAVEILESHEILVGHALIVPLALAQLARRLYRPIATSTALLLSRSAMLGSIALLAQLLAITSGPLLAALVASASLFWSFGTVRERSKYLNLAKEP